MRWRGVSRRMRSRRSSAPWALSSTAGSSLFALMPALWGLFRHDDVKSVVARCRAGWRERVDLELAGWTAAGALCVDSDHARQFAGAVADLGRHGDGLFA